MVNKSHLPSFVRRWVKEFACYRPQTKFVKVMFSQVSVCPRGRGVSVQGDLCPGEGVSVQGGLCPAWVSVQG